MHDNLGDMKDFQSASIFEQFPQIAAGLSHDVFDEAGAKELGFERLCLTHQIHSDTINETEPGLIPETGDALLTHAPGWLIGMRVADCATVLLYDSEKQVVSAIHSGWRGSKARIVPKAINRLSEQFGSDPKNIWAHVSPLAQKCCYEVQDDFLKNFDAKYIEDRNNKHYFDNQSLIYDQLIESAVPETQIQLDGRCTIHDTSLRSYRRDGDQAGRMLVVIGLHP